MGDADCGDCDCNCDFSDCECNDCSCDCCDDCCKGCICDFDECTNCQDSCSNDGDQGCGRECTKSDFDCCRCSCCDTICCIFYDDIYYYGYYNNYQGNVNNAQYRGYNQQRAVSSDRKSPQNTSNSKGRKNKRLRRLVKCLLPCGKPFWKILFLLLPFYILFSPILVSVFFIYTCICCCADCVGLKPSRHETTSHVLQEAGPLPQVMYRGGDRDHCQEQRLNILVTHPLPQHSESHSIETHPPNKNEPQVNCGKNEHPYNTPVQHNDEKMPPPISTENEVEPNVPPPPYSATETEEIHFTDLSTVSEKTNMPQNVKYS